MSERVGVTYALILLLCMIIMGGISWLVLYWGGMLPLQNNIVAQYGTSIFPTTDYTFMTEIGIFWGFIMTLAVLIWLWQQSTRRDSPSV